MRETVIQAEAAKELRQRRVGVSKKAIRVMQPQGKARGGVGGGAVERKDKDSLGCPSEVHSRTIT